MLRVSEIRLRAIRIFSQVALAFSLHSRSNMTQTIHFNKVLCATDFSPGSQQAVRAAARVASQAGAELVVLHAWHVPTVAYTLEAPFPPHIVQGVIDDAQRALDGAVKDAKVAGAKDATGKLVSGVPWMKIVDELASSAYDLCILGTHGRTGLGRVLLGSVVEKVVRHAPCSVLAVRGDGDLKPFRHVLVPTDFSDSAVFALDIAAALVDPVGAITLLHVIEIPVAFAGEVPIAEFARELDTQAASALETEVNRLKRGADASVSVSSRIGYPGAQTLAALDANPDIDLVVLGSHGRTGIKRALLGSVAEKVARHARCPVFVARKRT